MPRSSKHEKRGTSGHAASERDVSLGEMHFAAESYSIAAEYFLKALDSGTLEAADALTLRLRVCDCARLQGNIVEAEQHLVAAGDLVGESDRDRIEIGFRRAYILAGRGDLSSAYPLAADLYERLRHTDDHAAVGRAQTLLGHCHARSGEHEKAGEFFVDALSSFRRAGDDRGIAEAYNNLGVLSKNMCDWETSLRYFDRSLEMASLHGLSRLRGMIEGNIGVVHFKMRKFTEVLSTHPEVAERAERLGDRLQHTRALLLMGRTAAAAGFVDEAQTMLHRARAQALEHGYARETALADEILAEALIGAGSWREALLRLFEAVDRARETAPRGDVVAECLRRIADVQLRLGQVDAAIASIDEGIEIARRCGETYEVGYFLRARGRALQRTRDRIGSHRAREEAVRAFREHGNPFEAGVETMELARSLARGDDVADRRRAGILLEDAAASLEECGAPLERVRALIMLASVRRADKNYDGALAAAREAVAAARTISSPAAWVRAARKSLRRAERDVAEDAARVHRRVMTAGVSLSTRDEVQKELRASASLLLGHFDARSGCVMMRSVDGEWEPVFLKGMQENVAQAVVTWFADTQEKNAAGAPLVTHVCAGDNESLALGSVPNSALVLQRFGDGACGAVFCAVLRGADAIVRPSALRLLAAFAGAMSSGMENVSAPVAPRVDGDTLDRIVTNNDGMRDLFQLVEQVAPSNATVLLQGETGTGKGLFARAVHERSKRHERRFVHVNCAALPDTLLESELFGHVRGAFTGAVADKDGLLHEADGGTIFLDEISKTSLSTQGKLLQFLDTREVRRVGSNEFRPVDVRVICASKTDLLSMSGEGTFLEDLYYRINDFPIDIPPLRQRAEDIPLLAHHFATTISREMGVRIIGIAEDAMQMIVAHSWPGNVRELEKVIKRAVILATREGHILGEHLPTGLGSEAGRGADPGHAASLKQMLEQIERDEILKSLERNRWNKSRTASQLGMSYQNLLYKIKRHGLTG